ncbi:RHS repeat-associated core domain-containing protein [Pseudomonas sp.]|uniref:RHS repeat-associated core domain-containing protein n=1 Tax=Pseudomonas sp. TaxID=306 RepID=UPI0028A98271|nr:RHS repeat-associated core domain-containing protein [Pseudomonas sp.]
MDQNTDTTRHFYRGDRLHTALSVGAARSLFRTTELPLAEHEDSGTRTLLASDALASILLEKTEQSVLPAIYTPYGHTAHDGPQSLLGFAGEPRDTRTLFYLLGNGYRAFNPALLRFNSPDSDSPFKEGGINCYAYCAGDPVNFSDPTGHMYKPRYDQPLYDRGVHVPGGKQTGASRLSLPRRIDPLDRSRRPATPLQIQAQSQGASNIVVAAPSTSTSTSHQPEARTPTGIASVSAMISTGEHKPNHVNYKKFINVAVQTLLAFEKESDPKQARIKFFGSLSHKFSDKTYKKIINNVSAIRRAS